MGEQPTRRLSPHSAGLTAVAPERELAPGELVDDWQIVAPLARGGFGAVYEVRHQRTHLPAALKLLHAHLVTSAEMRARFEREIAVIRRLEHPHVVHLVGSGASGDGRPYLCMELLAGEDLSRLLRRQGPLPPARAVAILEPLCEALALAHERGIVHRDIKAANVFVCTPAAPEALGRVVLLDFGIAKLVDAFGAELTATSQALGTPASMAPEQIQGRRADARTDVYALGALLYHMLAGQLPLQDPSPTMTQYLHLHARRPRASAVVPGAPRLDDVIVRAMAIDPAERFADVRELFAAARAALRASAAVRAVEVAESAAILVTVCDRGGGAGLDEALLADLESVLPAAERALAAAGFLLAIDLGTSALFVARHDAGAATAAAVTTWTQLHAEPRHPRVQIAMCVHAGPVVFAGGEIQPAALLRPASWPIAEVSEGLWVTSAIDPSAAAGRRLA